MGKRPFANILGLVGVVALGSAALAQSADTYPKREWTVLEDPAELGWSAEKLHEAEVYAGTIDTAAVVIVHQGVVVAQWGEGAKPFKCESMRKSLLSALIGIHVDKGNIDLDDTLAGLGIDDLEPSLTDDEKQATVRNLLMSSSGIYHRAAYEPSGMAGDRPERGSAKPGEQFWYNNWDFNTLGTVFERESNTKVFEEFEARIAKPIGMQDFSLDDTCYVRARWSEHPAYLFDLSARDLARVGLLFARNGQWLGKRLVPGDWVRESTEAQWPNTGRRGGYGYMWWAANPEDHNLFGITTEPSAFMAAGSGGQRMLVLPQSDIVVVHRVANSALPGGPNVGHREFAQLLGLILAARPGADG